jgi:hypothetical protein
MKRTCLVLALVLAIAAVVASSASAKAYNSLGTVTGTSPLNDNNGTCAVPDLWPVTPGEARWIVLTITQAPSYAWSDSVQAGAGSTFTFTPPGVPSGTVCTLTVKARDAAGYGCATSTTKVPTVTFRPPAAPSFTVTAPTASVPRPTVTAPITR